MVLALQRVSIAKRPTKKRTVQRLVGEAPNHRSLHSQVGIIYELYPSSAFLELALVQMGCLVETHGLIGGQEHSL